MIRIAEVRVFGQTDNGQLFEGRMEFGSGLQIISAPNGYGKSMAAAAVAWCLGLEPIYGLQPGDASLFPEAARERLNLGKDRGVTVKSSQAHVVIVRNDKNQLELTRAIRGEQTNIIQWSSGNVKGNVTVGWGSMKDPTAGFQARFFPWAELPEAELMNAQGKEVRLYLENLAPLFFIEQTEGWADIQALQVYRYGISEVAEGAFEYLLGLDDALKARRMRQAGACWEAERREEARSLAKQFEEILWTLGGVVSSQRGNL